MQPDEAESNYECKSITVVPAGTEYVTVAKQQILKRISQEHKRRNIIVVDESLKANQKSWLAD